MREHGAEVYDVLRKCDNIAAHFVLTTLTDPHEAAWGGETAQHFFHLSEVMDETMGKPEIDAADRGGRVR